MLDLLLLVNPHPDVVNDDLPLDMTNFQGFNCLHVAAKKGSVHAVKAILRLRPGLAEVKKTDGFTPLHLACLNGKPRRKNIQTCFK